MGRQRPLLAAAMALAGGAGSYRWLVRPWMYSWGATAQETDAVLPGDELVEQGAPRTTRAITIKAPVQAVWPWLVQIGEDRGGFYSYDRLERLTGSRIRNTDVVHPEWQDLRVGDTVWLARRYGSKASQVVAAIEPNSHLVLMSPADAQRVLRGEKAFGSWAFYLHPQAGRTRLIARGTGGSAGITGYDIAHFVMERGMLRGIRARAERRAHPRADANSHS
ncbi:hypothetical protein MANY_09710 [Mycolicibacterium anyangense]|uniref:SRPBCC family protein n=1 Tax=Mycolicibacterium anyangense TaxID=1431246 RepID=A0A6N4W6C3_9MYCO|nr:hypothetical protein [Mycolicibacterium anyangense]BBZ75634.1 hypothetical protein MANY_09710 [Mycolicibacterium anyangense]